MKDIAELIDWAVEFAQTPWGVLLITFATAFVLTGKHLNRKDGIPLVDFLRAGGLETFYRAGTEWVLDRFDGWMVPPEKNDPEAEGYWPLTSMRRAWNWLAYDRMLLFAVAYPLLLPLFFWVLFATPWMLAGTEIAAAPEQGWQRLVLGAVLLVVTTNGWTARWLVGRWGQAAKAFGWSETGEAAAGGWVEKVVRVALIAGAVAAAAAAGFEFAEADAEIMAFVVVFAYPFVAPAAISGIAAGALAFASAIAFAVAFASAIASAFAVAFAFASAFAANRRWHPAGVYLAFSILAAVGLATALAVSPGWENDFWRVLFLFLGVLPLINAVFDFASIGWTRFCLRRALVAPDRPGPLNLHGIVWGLLDVAGAFVCLFGLGYALLFGIQGLNLIATEPLLDLPALLTDLRISAYDNPWPDTEPQMGWLYLMFFSTLLPTAAHLLLAIIGFAMRFPGEWARDHLARMARKAGGGDDRRTYVQVVMAAWATVWVGLLFVVPYWVLLPWAGYAHGDFIRFVVEHFWAVARWAGIL